MTTAIEDRTDAQRAALRTLAAVGRIRRSSAHQDEGPGNLPCAHSRTVDALVDAGLVGTIGSVYRLTDAGLVEARRLGFEIGTDTRTVEQWRDAMSLR